MPTYKEEKYEITWEDIAKEAGSESGIPRKDAARLVKLFFDKMREVLMVMPPGNYMIVPRLGKFIVKHIPARVRYNPRNLDEVELDDSDKINFQFNRLLKESRRNIRR